MVTDLSDVRLAVVGSGLIGASVGLAAKRAGVQIVSGFDSDPDALAVAVERGAVDRPTENLGEAVDAADLVVIATPVAVISSLVVDALQSTGRSCTVTDVGSTKAGMSALMAALNTP